MNLTIEGETLIQIENKIIALAGEIQERRAHSAPACSGCGALIHKGEGFSSCTHREHCPTLPENSSAFDKLKTQVQRELGRS